MKRTAAAFVLAAGLGGGCMTATPGTKTAATTTPPAETRAAPPDRGGLRPVGRGMTDPMRDAAVIQANAYGVNRVSGDPAVRQVNGYGGPAPGGPPTRLDPQLYGPTQSGLTTMFGHGGIMPTPGMGPWGAVALVPGAAIGPGGPGGAGGLYANGRTSINFVSTPNTSKMKVGFQDASRGFIDALVVPQSYNFVQGNIYRLRLSGIPNRPGETYYPTLEVYPATKDTVTFLSHTAVPIGFTDEDFAQVAAGNMVVKVIYLPSQQFQDVAAAEEIVSTRLEPGADPVVEATRRGTILAVIRIGNVNLENQNSPAMDAPPGSGPGGVPAPGGTPAPVPGLMSPPVPLGGSIDGKKTEPRPPLDLTAKPSKTVPADLPKISLPAVEK